MGMTDRPVSVRGWRRVQGPGVLSWFEDGAWVAELTGLLTLTGWPPGMRVIARKERPHPGVYRSAWQDTGRNGSYGTLQGTGGTSTVNQGEGTRLMNGRYFGDLAFINIAAGKSTAGRVHSSVPTADPVRGGVHVSNNGRDGFCTFGAATGTNCNWLVAETGATYRDVNTGELYRNLIYGVAGDGNCLRPGDSGGPSFMRDSSGIYAVGVNSGGGRNTGTGSPSFPCQTFATSIHHATDAFGGGLKRG